MNQANPGCYNIANVIYRGVTAAPTSAPEPDSPRLAAGTGSLDQAAIDATEIAGLLDLADGYDAETLRIALFLSKVLTRL